MLIRGLGILWVRVGVAPMNHINIEHCYMRAQFLLLINLFVFIVKTLTIRGDCFRLHTPLLSLSP